MKNTKTTYETKFPKACKNMPRLLQAHDKDQICTLITGKCTVHQ